jgi:hypothetical protein
MAKIFFSDSASQHGFGSDPFKWVSGATKAEREAAKRGDIVLFEQRVQRNGSSASRRTEYRQMVYKNGRYVPRVPDVSVVAAYKRGQREG